MTPHLDFWSWQLIAALIFNAVISALQIGAYAARLAGARTGRVATSISLFNLFATVSRLAALFYTLMLGPLADRAGNAARHASLAQIGQIQHIFDVQLRLIIIAGTVGTLLGGLLLPMFTYMYVRGVRSFERTRSIPHSLIKLFYPSVIASIVRHIRIPNPSEVFGFSLRRIPKRLLVFNVIVTGIYAVGVVAAYYASVLAPVVARTALGTSGLINGIGTVAFTLFVDPTASIIVDEAVKGERPHEDVKSMVFYLALTAVIGWILSQFILWPSAEFISIVAHLVNHGR